MNNEEIDMDCKAKNFTEVCYNNFGIGSIHIELNVNCMALIPSIENMHYEVEKFIRKIRVNYSDFMYIATIEKLGAGNFRCNMLCNPDISENDLNLWHNGKAHKDTINSFDVLDEFIEVLVLGMQSNSYMRSRNLRIIKEM
ncbi:MAG: hypothetical protein K2H29_04075 [Oscillospiraceae bacterium]|nr:hypothetical protein [Oscillospiraceae bacterium]